MKKIIVRGFQGMTLFLGSTAAVLAQTYSPVINSGGANASGQAMGQSLLDLMTLVQTLVNRAVPLLIGIAVVALFVGILGFLFNKEEAQKHAAWGKFLGFAILALFVMVSIWGLVNFLGAIFGIGQGGGVPVPQIPVRTGTY